MAMMGGGDTPGPGSQINDVMFAWEESNTVIKVRVNQ